jgi:N-acetylmuramic acid 6-phosphate etherase
MNDIDSEVLPAVRAAAPAIAQAIEGATERLGRGGRIIYFGAGTSGRIGMLDAAECPPTFGVEPELVQAQLAGGPEAFQRAKEGVEDSPEAGAADVETLGVDETDVAVGIAASGRTPYVLGALRRAGELGALTVAIACVEGSAIGREAQVVIEVVTGPEILTGSTRLKAGTAQKMVLNMLSTGVMVQMGKVYENLMVDVKATNAKLRQRAVGIVREVTGEPDDRAQAALEACEWSVKPACLVAARGLSPAEASALLSRHGGRLREALRAPDHA